MKMRLLFLCLAVAVAGCQSLPDGVVAGPKSAVPTPDGKGSLSYAEHWGYTTVREGAHSFWWLYSSDDTPNRPLILWFQGGPGASGVGFGNFQELGPVSDLGKNRSTTWLHRGDLLFIDCPVGAGFSYVDHTDQLTKDIDEVATDLVSWAKQWFVAFPQYQTREFYIFCESYGGKFAAAFGGALSKAIQAGDVKTKLKGVALGDAWISPVDFTNTWAPYLHATNYFDYEQREAAQKIAKRCEENLNSGNGEQATQCWSELEGELERMTSGVSFYNILKYSNEDPWSRYLQNHSTVDHLERAHRKLVLDRQGKDLGSFMNGEIRRKLKIIPASVRWGGQSGAVFSRQSGDFMKPVIDKVDYLLNNTDVRVVVYNGQLDLICDTLGTELWVRKLKWSGLSAWKGANRRDFRVGQTDAERRSIAGYYKQHKQFYFFWVMRAGHMVPHDTPFAMYFILDAMLT